MGADVVERSGVFVQSQYKAETYHDTAVTPDTMFRALKLTPTAKLTTHEIDPGGLFPVGYAKGKEWTEIKAEGIPSYEEMAVVLTSLLCVPATGIYNPSNTSENTYTSYSIQIGTARQCEKVAGAAFVGMTLKYDENDVTIDCDLIGQKIATGATWATGASYPTLTPILPGQCTVELSGVAQTRVLSSELSLTNRWKPLYVLTGSESYVNLVEGRPDGSIKVMCEADTEGLAHLTRLQAGNATIKYTMKATIAAAHTLQFDCATEIKEVDAFQISDTTYNIGYTLGIVYSSTLGYAIKATLVES